MAVVVDENEYTLAVNLFTEDSWFHGRISRDEAERALATSAAASTSASASVDCFLLRESAEEQRLILSQLHRGEMRHIKILYGPGGGGGEGGEGNGGGYYAFEGYAKTFVELRELVEHYRTHPISDELGTLGLVCPFLGNRFTEFANEEPVTADAGRKGEDHYTLGSLALGDHKDWYHGEIDRVEAERVLRACDHDCFLLRWSKGSLVLSLTHTGKPYHTKVCYGPGWYKLHGARESFPEIPDLVSHYRQNTFSSGLMLGEVCRNMKQEPAHEDTTSEMEKPGTPETDADTYSRGGLEFSKEAWFRGELSREEAEQELRSSDDGGYFLVHQNKGSLFLSVIHHEEFSHLRVEYGPGWYRLEGLSPRFKNLSELVGHYCSHSSPNGAIQLALACQQKKSLLEESLESPWGESDGLYAEIDGGHDNDVYTKGSLLGPDDDKDWYHRELGKEAAEKALEASTGSAFLIRQNQQSLYLSLITRCRRFHHLRVRYSPRGYRLEGGFTECNELDELVAFYRENAIMSNGIDATLGAVCGKQDTIYEVISGPTHLKGEPEDITNYAWYHGKISQSAAERTLNKEGVSPGSFLIWLTYSSNCFTLSWKRWDESISHHDIHYSSDGYQLRGCEAPEGTFFKSVMEMIAYYREFPIFACDEAPPASASQEVLRDAIPYGTSDNLMGIFSDKTKSIFERKENRFSLSWERCASLPIRLSAPQVVRIGGSVYVGGGINGAGDNEELFRYSVEEDVWAVLPPSPTCQYGLATWDGELIAVGGRTTRKGNVTKKVYTFRESSATWMQMIPSMLIARCFLSTLTHENLMIIAAGGVTGMDGAGQVERTSTVEIFSRESRRWSTTKSLPFPRSSFSMTVFENRCFILGGAAEANLSCKTVYEDLRTLLMYTVGPKPESKWKKLPKKHPLIFSSLVEVSKQLVAIGGCAKGCGGIHRPCTGTKFVSTFRSSVKEWVECEEAELPVALYRPGVVKLLTEGGRKRDQEEERVMVIGGQSDVQKFSATTFIGTHSMPSPYEFIASSSHENSSS